MDATDDLVDLSVELRINRSANWSASPCIVGGGNIRKADLLDAILAAKLFGTNDDFGGNIIISMPHRNVTILRSADGTHDRTAFDDVDVPGPRLNVTVWAEELFNYFKLGHQWIVCESGDTLQDVEELPLYETDSASALVALPYELLVQIQSYLGPTEILAFRRTCRKLAFVTHDRRTWATVVTSIYKKYNGFLPFFDCSLPLRLVLETAALAPNRLASALVTRPPDRALFPRPSLVKHHHVYGLQLSALLLVPGGRFLFTVVMENEDERCWIHLWDLISDPIEICSVVHEAEWLDSSESLLAFIIPQAGAGDDTVYADTEAIHFVVTTWDSSGVRRMCVYETCPLSPNPKMNILATLNDPNLLGDNTESEIEFLKFSKGRITFLMEHTVVIWDYKADMSAAWKITSADNLSDLLLLNDLLILSQWREIMWWRVPPLVPNSELGQPQLLQPNEVSTLPFPSSTSFGYIECVNSVSLAESDHSAARLVYRERKGTQHYLHHFDAKAVSSTGGTSVDLTFLSKAPVPVPPDGLSISGRFPGCFCEDLLVSPWLSHGRYSIWATVTEYFDDCSQHRNKDVLLCSAPPGLSYWRFVEFCPLSGRLCGSDAESNIYVFDL